MIVDFLLYILFNVIQVFAYPLSLLPDAQLPSGFAGTITAVSGYMSAVNIFLPTTTLIAVVSSIILIEGFILTFKLISWLIRKIPTIS